MAISNGNDSHLYGKQALMKQFVDKFYVDLVPVVANQNRT